MSAEDTEETLSPEELAQIPRVEHSAEVEERCDRFTEFYTRNRHVIENRWIRMTKQLRLELLARNWRASGGTGMPQEHAPDLTELVPWRDPTIEGKTRSLCPPRAVNHNYLRWPIFNQNDLSDTPHPFLQLLLSRSTDHPKEFAALDTFRENRETAILSMKIVERGSPEDIKPLVRIYSGGLRIKSGSWNSDQGDSIYGAVETMDSQEDYDRGLEARQWTELAAQHLLFNQRRIYHFLEAMVTDIMAENNEARYRVDQEDVQTPWEPQPPDADSLPEERFRQRREEYLDVCRSIVPYKAMAADMWEYASQIITRRIEIYEDRVRSLKAHPGSFMQYLVDIRQHSHHEVSYSYDRIHPFANLADNQNNGRMWAKYLLRALHHATEGLDFWRTILTYLDNFRQEPTAAEDDTDVDFPIGEKSLAYLLMFYVTVFNIVRPLDLKDTLACSPSIRKYFRNTSYDEKKPVFSSGLPGYPALPNNNPKVASLVSLLRTMTEADVDSYMHLKGVNLANEILSILQGRGGGTWMTNFGLEKAEEHHDAATVWLILQRWWSYNDLNAFNPFEMVDRLPEGQKWSDQLGPSNRLLDLNIDDIVAKYMIPYPEARFEYPPIKANLKPTKRRENARKRRESEARLRALWADLQARLEEEGAISEETVSILNSAILSATGEDGSDVTPTEPPAPPQPEAPSTPPQGPASPPGPGSPHTPPGGPNPPGSAATGTPTQQLGGLGINSPPNRPPPMRTPERKTVNDGVKKISPIRPARPDEDRPRRPQIDRRTRAAAREEARRARAQPPPVRVVAPPPQPPPPQAVEYPKIPLSAKSYDLVRRVYVTSSASNPGGILWEDVRSLFRDIGFYIVGRPSRGGLDVFYPTERLGREQGIGNLAISRDKPHTSRLSFTRTREFLRGRFAFGKYGWDFDKFIER